MTLEVEQVLGALAFSKPQRVHSIKFITGTQRANGVVGRGRYDTLLTIYNPHHRKITFKVRVVQSKRAIGQNQARSGVIQLTLRGKQAVELNRTDILRILGTNRNCAQLMRGVISVEAARSQPLLQVNAAFTKNPIV
ncbi:hypothetical protein [Marinicrinis sediminis]|uniref:Uncharacterized protein n=1 Tax=Marinicrinis sediminis TaxID=1652465 RepID=A0ABW5RD36_9BACL